MPAHPLRKLLATDRWLVVDTETTGRDERAEAVELAVVEARGEVLFASLIQPSIPVSAAAARLHRLTPKGLSGAPTMADVYEPVHSAIAGRALLAYHASFDRRVLANSCARAGLPAIAASWHCALDFYEALRGFRPPLATACEIEGVEMSGRPHRAVEDALALRALLLRLRSVAG